MLDLFQYAYVGILVKFLNYENKYFLNCTSGFYRKMCVQKCWEIILFFRFIVSPLNLCDRLLIFIIIIHKLLRSQIRLNSINKIY